MTTPEPSSAQSLPRRFLFNVNFVFLFALISNTTGFMVAILLARALTREGRGDTALFQAAVGIGVAFVNLGVGSAVFYFVSRREITGRQAMETGLTITLLTAIVAAIGVLITAVFFEDNLQANGIDIPYGMAIVAAPAFIQLRVTEGLLRAQGRFGVMNALELSLPVCMIVILGATELLFGLNVPRAVIAWSLSFLPPVFAGYVLLGRDVWPHGFAGSALLRQTIRFGGQSALTNLVQLANYRADTFLIAALVSREGVAIYTVANSQVEGLLILSNSVAIVLLTNITAGDRENAARLTPIVCRNTMLVTGVAAIVAALIVDLWLPAVFGSKYQASVEPYLWLLPGMVAIAGAKILGAYVFSRGLPIINFWIAVANLAITTPITVALLLIYDVPGAAVGTSIGYVLMLAMTAYAYSRLSDNPVYDALMPRRADVRIYTDAVRTAFGRIRGRTAPEPALAAFPPEGDG
ncbi:MAG TPA: oligosaccharide flippase family protein [Dehalococcoidia bacterium]|nr:oligosaccharide flippase family protein [Dehalococcoidia bacterium]